IFWVDLKKVDFSKENGKVKKLDLGPEQQNIYSGDVAKDFTDAKPFVFQG
ncbi:choloylglycine hydrolase, partial [Salmonella enterica]|nr:choloylglycine hydrolase [Salmonella enterica]